MSKPYYGPVEDEDTINLERFFLAGDFISGIGYGMFAFPISALTILHHQIGRAHV